MDRKTTSTSTKYIGITIRRSTKSSAIQIRFTYKGITCREVLNIEPTEANQRYASRLRSEIMNKIERGTFSYIEYFPASKKAKVFGFAVSKVTLGKLLKDYLITSEKTLEESTYVNYRKVINKYLIPELEHILAIDFTPRHIRALIKKLNKSLKTTRNILTPLRNVIEEAINDDIISKNPFDRVIVKKNIDIEKLNNKEEEDVDPFTKQEINAIIRAAQPELAWQLQFWFFTGLRPSEFFEASWADVDFIKKQIRIWKTVVYGKRKDRTKTKAGTRFVTLLPPALEALKNLKQYTFLAGNQINVNPRKREPYIRDKQFREWIWRPLLKKAGIRYRYPYNIRHTWASMMLSNGENIMWVAKQMGHTTVATVIKVYGKFIPDGSVATGYQTKTEWGNFLEVSNK